MLITPHGVTAPKKRAKMTQIATTEKRQLPQDAAHEVLEEEDIRFYSSNLGPSPLITFSENVSPSFVMA